MNCLHLGLHDWQPQVFSIDDPWSEVDNLRCRKNVLANESFDNGIAYFQFSRRLLLCYPAILPLERLDFVIAAQSSDARCIPSLLLSSLVS
jgi:hypothetical protein